jgi:hypothetical protein
MLCASSDKGLFAQRVYSNGSQTIPVSPATCCSSFVALIRENDLQDRSSSPKIRRYESNISSKNSSTGTSGVLTSSQLFAAWSLIKLFLVLEENLTQLLELANRDNKPFFLSEAIIRQNEGYWNSFKVFLPLSISRCSASELTHSILIPTTL